MVVVVILYQTEVFINEVNGIWDSLYFCLEEKLWGIDEVWAWQKAGVGAGQWILVLQLLCVFENFIIKS